MPFRIDTREKSCMLPGNAYAVQLERNPASRVIKKLAIRTKVLIDRVEVDRRFLDLQWKILNARDFPSSQT